ncbi:hypothetical protein [Tahibacter aquaticus]|uniref:hypothetical protein n=1 Tax=Tahibacter aquaticus TaxID=520092 RepID=UPI00105E990C|nr:hypothetical protein [Tahibacter aquaticus]
MPSADEFLLNGEEKSGNSHGDASLVASSPAADTKAGSPSMARFSSNRPTSAPSLRLRLGAHLCADVLKQVGDHAQANRSGYGDISVDECGFERVAAVLDHLVVDGDADMYPERIAIDIEQRRTRMTLERTTTTVVRKRSIFIASARRIRSPESIRQNAWPDF